MCPPRGKYVAKIKQCFNLIINLYILGTQGRINDSVTLRTEHAPTAAAPSSDAKRMPASAAVQGLDRFKVPTARACVEKYRDRFAGEQPRERDAQTRSRRNAI